jgi:carbonic anhydrase/acetyltransferase-like protein (isoleucine patch superfamily)
MLVAVAKQLRMMLGKALRETGQALDRAGSSMTRDVAYMERYSRHRKLMPIDQLWPSHGKSFIAPNASLIGEVLVGTNCAVMYGAVLRGDISAVRIDDNVIIGDNSTIQTVGLLPDGVPKSVTIASGVLVEPHCSLTSCIVDTGVWIGSGSVVQQGAKLEQGSVLLPGSIVSPGFTVPAFSVFGGSPAKMVREVTLKDVSAFQDALKRASEQAQRNDELLASLGH